jgi:hypothetical protein
VAAALIGLMQAQQCETATQAAQACRKRAARRHVRGQGPRLAQHLLVCLTPGLVSTIGACCWPNRRAGWRAAAASRGAPALLRTRLPAAADIELRRRKTGPERGQASGSATRC